MMVEGRLVWQIGVQVPEVELSVLLKRLMRLVVVVGFSLGS